MAISTETIRKITIQAQGKGDVDALKDSLNNLGTASGNLATVTDVATRRQLSAADAYKRQTLAVVEGARAQDQLARSTKVVGDALQQGKITAEQAADRMTLLQQKYAGATEASHSLETATHGLRGGFELARGALELFGVTLGAAALVEYGKHVLETTAALQEQADQVLGAGGNVEALQAMRGVFLQNNIAVQDGDTILSHLTKSLGEAADGSKTAQDAFGKLHLGAKQLAGQGADASLPLIAQRLLDIKDAGARATIETALFGKTGQQLESALRALAVPMNDLIAKAKELGIVIDAEMIKKADEAKDRMALSWMKLSVAVSPIVTRWAEDFANFAGSIDGATSSLDRMIHKIEAAVAVYAGARIGGLFGPLGAVAGGVIGGTVALATQQDPATIQKSIANINAQIAAGGSPSEQAERRLRLGNYQQQLAGLQGPESVTVTPQKYFGTTTAPAWKPTQQDIDAYNKIKETYADFLVTLKEGAKVAGLSTVEQEKQSTIIQGAQVYQKEHNVAARDLVRSYGDAVAVLQKHGLLQGVINTLDTKHSNELQKQNAAAQDNLDYLNAQIGLVGKSNLEQATTLALLKEQQALKQQYGDGFDPANPTADQQAAIDLKVAEAAATVNLTVANDNYNESLSGTRDLMAELAQNANDAANGLGESFGKVGKAIGGAAASYANYNALQADFKAQQREIDRDALNHIDVTQRQTVLTQKQSDAEDQYYAAAIDGVKNLFGQKTAAYQAISVVEAAYNASRLASNIVAMASDVSAGAARIFAELGPWGFPVVGAMIAVMAGLGFAGGGSSGAPAVDIAKQRQSGQGAGTVLGDATTKSDSIAKSLDQLTKDTNTDLEYSNQMVTSLKAIENSIGSLTSLLARQLSVGGLFDTSNLNLGTTGGNGGLLSTLFGGIFGSGKTTNTLLDQGIQIAATTIGQAVAGGISASAYQTVESTKTKSYLFGLVSSTKTTTGTTATPLSGDFTGGISSIIGALRATVLDAATKLGLDGAKDVVDSFALNLGSISFKDMTGSQIQDTLTQVFGALGDKIAAAAVPQIAQLQLVGEGALETLSRLVNEYTAVDDAAKIVGFTFSALGADSLQARDNLVQMSGGLDQFTSQAQFFSDNFLTKAQALVPIQQAVNDELARLGETGITTKDQFAALVQGLDTSTTTGAALYAALQNVAPAFAKVADAAQALSDQSTKLQITLLTDTGDAVGALALKRQQELAALDASLVPLQKQIYAAEDLNAANKVAADAATAAAAEDAAAAQKAAAVATARTNLEITLMQDTGDAAGALALKRQTEIAALDASLVPLQQQIFAAEDLNTAVAAATAALNQSFSDLSTGIGDLTGTASESARVAQTAADSWGNAYQALSQASTALLISSPGLSPLDQYNASRSQFNLLRGQALGGDATAAGNLAGFASQFLQTSFGYNGSTSAYGSDFATVQSTLSSLSQFSSSQQSAAQAQANALNAMVAKLNEIAAAIRDHSGIDKSGFDELSGQVKDLADEIAQENLQARHA